MTFLATSLLFGWAVLRASDLLLGLPRWQRVVAGVALPLVAVAVAKLLANGLLSIAIRLTRMTPARTPGLPQDHPGGDPGDVGAGLRGRRRSAAARAGARRRARCPRAAGERVAAPRRRRHPGGGVRLPPGPGFAAGDVAPGARRSGRGALPATPPKLEPAEFWTTIATGVSGERHGVRSLDSFRPLGLTSALARSGPWRAWWSGVAVPLGLAEHRPLLANRRTAFTFWELAARGGAPAVAVDWWATFPPSRSPGWWSPTAPFSFSSTATSMPSRRPTGPPSSLGWRARSNPVRRARPWRPRCRRSSPTSSSAGQCCRTVSIARPRVRESAKRPQAMALYLPAVDLLAEGWIGGDVALADLVRAELEESDSLIAALAEGARHSGDRARSRSPERAGGKGAHRPPAGGSLAPRLPG